MVAVRFKLTTNDPWSVHDAICEGISPLGYLQKVNQSPTQTKPYNTYSVSPPCHLTYWCWSVSSNPAVPKFRIYLHK